MTEVKPLETVTIDGVSYTIEELVKLDPNLQHVITQYDEWRGRLNIARDEVLLVESALRDLSGNIIHLVRNAVASQEQQNPEVVNDVVDSVEANVNDNVGQLDNEVVNPSDEILVIEQ